MTTLTRGKTEVSSSEAREERVGGALPSPFPVHCLALGISESTVRSANHTVLSRRSSNPGFDASKSKDADKSQPETREAMSGGAVEETLKGLRQSFLAILAHFITQGTLPLGGEYYHDAPVHFPLPGPASSFPPTAPSLRTIMSSLSKSPSLAFSISELELPKRIIDNIRKQTHLGEMETHHGALATSLVLLIEHLDKLLDILPPSSTTLGTSKPAQIETNTTDPSALLTEALRTLRSLSMKFIPHDGSSPSRTEQTMLWRSLEGRAEEVGELFDQNDAALSLPPPLDWDHPPHYEMEPPRYDPFSVDHKSSLRHAHTSPDLHRLSILSASSNASAQDNKLKLEFEAVAQAIDRLNTVAPQIHSQRVELWPAKQKEMELARLFGDLDRMAERRLNRQRVSVVSPIITSGYDATKGKGRAIELDDDLDHLIELIGRSHDMRISNQCVSPTDEMRDIWRNGKQTTARPRESLQQEQFVDSLMKYGSQGRLHSQDATFSTRTAPGSVENNNAPSVLVKGVFGGRGRSNSAPLIVEKRLSAQGKKQSYTLRKTEEHYSYVAELQENLRTVQLLVDVPLSPQTAWTAEVISRGSGESCSSTVLIRGGPSEKFFVSLPANAYLGPVGIRRVQNHLEAKIPLHKDLAPDSDFSPIHDAAALTSLQPTSFICASCSLPLVKTAVPEESSRSVSYSDLPSDHWAEFIESWMCHKDLHLSESYTKRGRQGVEPSTSKILVGGSHMLCHQRLVHEENLSSSSSGGTEWQVEKCLCGSPVGHAQAQYASPARTVITIVYRFAKYAVLPHRPSILPLRHPLTAFILSDMMEFINAHANYRFVIHDEEGDKIRLLMWLFKPSIKLSYALTRTHGIPQEGIIQGAKVLYKLVGPSERLDPQDLRSSFPDFAQAEHLSYPLNVCHSIAAFLAATNHAYPVEYRTLKNLHMGWLQKTPWRRNELGDTHLLRNKHGMIIRFGRIQCF
ncbi:HECT-like ubiquitin-conjugating enzyme-binding-domain-containing protein [Cantharellus anzutake]|uniref:HECT-like ubiquitin-conjugating enzyme-binding-domain-containing protein n=1 Tax=Cantharellus anzutake TaxID=1750568 RepID=UPI001906A98D|nr:HECT-like ubiquitin-conjugating enzyme-binding-domain-containing protein [Cantharellus anzutake]KAF8331278.1 HECT-like ubiquitin-conjugating enzyme-binding-domain-containing protein [Cantharellus anzutake]